MGDFFFICLVNPVCNVSDTTALSDGNRFSEGYLTSITSLSSVIEVSKKVNERSYTMDTKRWKSITLKNENFWEQWTLLTRLANLTLQGGFSQDPFISVGVLCCAFPIPILHEM